MPPPGKHQVQCLNLCGVASHLLCDVHQCLYNSNRIQILISYHECAGMSRLEVCSGGMDGVLYFVSFLFNTDCN